jgi:hypothetical protein
MNLLNSLTNLIFFSITLIAENFFNLIIFNKYLSISPFYVLLFIFSLTRFNNKNIFPIMGTGLIYDIFLSENYLGLYTIVFLLVSVSINYTYEKVVDFNFKLVFIFGLNYIIYNIPNILSFNFVTTITFSIFVNYLLFLLIKKVTRLRV